jgi:hypothetical protein
VHRGNRRFVVVAALGALLAVALVGCSAGSPLTSSEDAAVAIGQEAGGFTSSSSPQPTTGWSSPETCPTSLEQGLQSAVPAGATVTELDVAIVHGVGGEPDLTDGDTPSCAYALTASGRTVDEVIFVGMEDSYQAAIVAKLTAGGFVVTSTTTMALGTEQVYRNGSAQIAVQKLKDDGISVFAVIG